MPLASRSLEPSPDLVRMVARWSARFRCHALPLPEPLDDRRTYLRFPPEGESEAWLIRWPPNSVAPLHDHGSATAAIAVLRGELRERFVERWRTRSRILGPGVIVALPPDHVHEVENCSDQVAYSIHIYAPMLQQMTFYQAAPDGSLRPTHREHAGEWGAVVAT